MAEWGGFEPPVPRALLWAEFGARLEQYPTSNKQQSCREKSEPSLLPDKKLNAFSVQIREFGQLDHVNPSFSGFTL